MGHGEVLFNHQQLSFPLLINDLATKLLDELFNSDNRKAIDVLAIIIPCSRKKIRIVS